MHGPVQELLACSGSPTETGEAAPNTVADPAALDLYGGGVVQRLEPLETKGEDVGEGDVLRNTVIFQKNIEMSSGS
jgi:hypothetical protein